MFSTIAEGRAFLSFSQTDAAVAGDGDGAVAVGALVEEDEAVGASVVAELPFSPSTQASAEVDFV